MTELSEAGSPEQCDIPDVSRVDAGRSWAEKVGYSRALRIGSQIEVAGTVAVDADGEVVAPGDPYLQARAVLDTIVSAVEQLGGDRSDVIRTRVFMTSIAQWEEVGRAHLEHFGEVLPVSSFVGINELLHPDLVVEIEAAAVVRDRDDRSE